MTQTPSSQNGVTHFKGRVSPKHLEQHSGPSLHLHPPLPALPACFQSHHGARVGDLDVAPPAVDHVALAQHAHLRLERRETDEAEALALARLGVLLHLRTEWGGGGGGRKAALTQDVRDFINST